MKHRALAAPLVALLCVSACTATPDATPSATDTPTHQSSAAIASSDVTPLTTSTGAALPEGDPARINCTVDGTGRLTWTATSASGVRTGVDMTLPAPDSGKALWQAATFGAGWVLAIVPGDVNDLDVIADNPNEAGHDYSVGAGYLDAVDSTCLAIRYDNAADAAKVQGLIWRVAGGTFRKDTGEAVTTLDVSAGGDTLSLYHDTALDVFGVVTASGYEGSYRPGRSSDPFPCMLFSTAQSADGKYPTFFVGVLPAGSKDLKMQFLRGAADPSLQTVAAASGEVFLVAAAKTAKQAGEIFDDISYINANGKKVEPRWGGS